MAVVGILMALLERSRTEKGQVVEIDMVRCFLLPPSLPRLTLMVVGNWNSLHLLLPSHDVTSLSQLHHLGSTSRPKPP
jgi:crotonobetainyl-CoA:carnitine CoA-transferase CaiB-like acyl-CoA transferase